MGPNAETPQLLKPLQEEIRLAIEADPEAHRVVINPKTGDELTKLKRPIPAHVWTRGRTVLYKYMDGDLPGITDTPASIHEISAAEVPRLDDPRFVINVRVTLSDGQAHTYEFEPDRTNIMGYARPRSRQQGMSQQQAAIVRSVLDTQRQHLLGPGLRWSGWAEVQGDGATDAAPAAAALGDRLYVFVKGNGGPRIYMNSAQRGQPFGQWTEVPGEGETDSAPAAIAFAGRLYLFVKGNGSSRIFHTSAEPI